MPPPLALQPHSLVGQGIDSGKSILALPSPVIKTLRGEANGYPGVKHSPSGLSPLFAEFDSGFGTSPYPASSASSSCFEGDGTHARALPTPPQSPSPCHPSAQQGVEKPVTFNETFMSSLDPDFSFGSVDLALGALEEESIPTAAQEALSKHSLSPLFLEAYSIGDELGSGGFGFVCSAWSRIEKREVAVKFIYKDRLHQKAVVQDWQDGSDCQRRENLRLVPMEAAILQFVNHPGIIKFKALFEDDVFFYLVSL